MTRKGGQVAGATPEVHDHEPDIDAAVRAASEQRGTLILHELAAGADAQVRLPEASAPGGAATVLRAAGRPSERSYAFGVVMQLFDGLWLDGAQPALFTGAGRLTGQLLAGELTLERLHQAGEAFPVVRSLMSVVQALSRGADDHGPVVLCVDSLHHADAPSLRFLSYLAARLDELSAAVILVGEQGAPYADLEAIEAIRAQAGAPPGSADVTVASARRAAATPPAPIVVASHIADTGQVATMPGRIAEDDPVQVAARAGLAGDHRHRVRELAEKAWGDPRVSDRLHDRPWMTAQLLRGLLVVDELELATEILADERHQLAERADLAAAGVACELRAWLLLHQGRVTAAADEAQRGLDEPFGLDVKQSLQAAAAACLVHSGRLSDAEALLKSLDSAGRHHPRVLATMLETRGQLRLAQHLPAEALRDAMEAQRRSSISEPQSYGPASWRCVAARAHAALGRQEHGRDLARRELELADARDVTRRSIGAYRAMAAAASPPEQIAALERAVAIGDAAPSRLEHLYALIDLGSALRRNNQRRAGRVVLGRAIMLAEELGAEGPGARARDEMAAAGGRRARLATTGLEALTPSERRVAHLAADGRSTREIAGELFITTKTVEFHLRHIYRKLEISSSRGELARVLNAPPAEPGPDD